MNPSINKIQFHQTVKITHYYMAMSCRNIIIIYIMLIAQQNRQPTEESSTEQISISNNTKKKTSVTMSKYLYPIKFAWCTNKNNVTFANNLLLISFCKKACAPSQLCMDKNCAEGRDSRSFNAQEVSMLRCSLFGIRLRRSSQFFFFFDTNGHAFHQRSRQRNKNRITLRPCPDDDMIQKNNSIVPVTFPPKIVPIQFSIHFHLFQRTRIVHCIV